MLRNGIVVWVVSRDEINNDITHEISHQTRIVSGTINLQNNTQRRQKSNTFTSKMVMVFMANSDT